ncbi:MAG: hypothetical protein LQ352_001081 [Teloschistes flavicans]|nr:MAG: hypothetical protein LQ352_001081 [Teloschistes flavicans]
MSRPSSSPPKAVPPSKRPKLGHTTSTMDVPSPSASSSTTAVGPPPPPQQSLSPPYSPSESPPNQTSNLNITDLIAREATRLQAANHLVRARNELLETMRANGVQKAVLVDGAGNIDDHGNASGTNELPPQPYVGVEALQGEASRWQFRKPPLVYSTERSERESEQGRGSAETPDDQQMLDNMSTEGLAGSNEELDLPEEPLEGTAVPCDEGTLREEGEAGGHMQVEKQKEQDWRREQAGQDKVAEPTIQDFTNEEAELGEVQKQVKGSRTPHESEKVQAKAKGSEISKVKMPSGEKQNWEFATSEGSGRSLGSIKTIGPFQKRMSGTNNNKETESANQESGEYQDVSIGEVISKGRKDKGKGKEKEQEQGIGVVHRAIEP